MLDFVRRDTSLEMKRQELAAQVAEGRAAIAALMARQVAINEKIEMASTGLRKLEKQLEAMNTVVRLFSDEDIAAARAIPAAPPPAPVLKVVSEPASSRPASSMSKPQPFRPTAYLQCLSEGHSFVTSRSHAGQVTCSHCRIRRKG